MLIGCPKLEEASWFAEKLIEILRANDIEHITVLHMEVPCCTNLVRLVSEAVKRSRKNIPVDQYNCMIEGSIIEEDNAPRFAYSFGHAP